MSLRGFAAGSLALIALETLVQDGASSRVGGLLGKSAELVQHVLSPTVPGLHWYASSTGPDAANTTGQNSGSSSAVTAAYAPTNPTVAQFQPRVQST